MRSAAALSAAVGGPGRLAQPGRRSGSKAARERAQGRLEGRVPVDSDTLDLIRAEAALRRALVRLNVLRRRSAPVTR